MNEDHLPAPLRLNAHHGRVAETGTLGPGVMRASWTRQAEDPARPNMARLNEARHPGTD